MNQAFPSDERVYTSLDTVKHSESRGLGQINRRLGRPYGPTRYGVLTAGDRGASAQLDSVRVSQLFHGAHKLDSHSA